ncbi:MAG: hypothetical protein ABR569_05015, partial [Gaiellaceae bacterium]
MADLREAAFYYPGVIWHDPDWIKSLTLFFDEIALLVPDYMRERPHLLDPAIAEGLQQAGLLRILSPEDLIDRAASEALASGIADVLAGGALDQLPAAGPFQALSWSRMGGYGDEGLARMLLEELQERGLARQSEDGVSIPLHPLVRSLFLVLLSQILREAGPRVGLELSPTTDRPEIHDALVQLLNLQSPTPTAGQVVNLDVELIGPDLSAVPLDEVLDFRAAHGDEFRAYARRLRQVVCDLALVPTDEQARVLGDRREEIREAGEALRGGPIKTLGSVAAIGLGIAGGVVSAATGAPVGGLLAAASAGAGFATLP